MGKKSMGFGFSLVAGARVSAVSTSPARFLNIIYEGGAALQIQLIRLPFYEWSCNVRNQFDNVRPPSGEYAPVFDEMKTK